LVVSVVMVSMVIISRAFPGSPPRTLARWGGLN
jgi:hypothetical protein